MVASVGHWGIRPLDSCKCRGIRPLDSCKCRSQINDKEGICKVVPILTSFSAESSNSLIESK